MTLTKSRVPQRYILRPSQCPNLINLSTTLPILNLSFLHHTFYRSHIIDEIGKACKKNRFFQELFMQKSVNMSYTLLRHAYITKLCVLCERCVPIIAIVFTLYY
jgi:hypothetical protein